MNKMTTDQALQCLDIATTPANAGKLSRIDYANVQTALAVLDEFVKANTPKPAESEPKTP
jgi:hypothetical protein